MNIPHAQVSVHILDDVPDDPDEIVSFVAPPVAEVVTSVRFSPMPIELFVQLGTLHQETWRDEFPTVEQQPPYEMPTEQFAASGTTQGPTFRFGFGAVPSLPRLWLVAPSQAELLQLQADWFAANWRGQAVPGGTDEVSYPRWSARRRAFAEHWRTVSGWLRERGHTATPTQCEVTYINHIHPIVGLWKHHAEIGRVLPTMHMATHAETSPEHLTWRAQYEVAAEGELPQARLHISMTPGFAGPGPEPSPVVVLELTVRGAPTRDGGLLPVLDRGRRVIVNTFLDITSQEAREKWGQR